MPSGWKNNFLSFDLKSTDSYTLPSATYMGHNLHNMNAWAQKNYTVIDSDTACR